MNESLKAVLEFHDTFEHPIGADSNHYEPLKTRQLRIKLIFEELAELAEAGDVNETMYSLCKKYASDYPYPITGSDGDNVNKLEELDALADIQYVLNGKILTSGLKDVFDAGFKQVHENNMTKAHRDESHALETAKINNLEGYKILTRNGSVLLNNKDGKLIKPHDHVKVKLKL